MYSMSIIDCKCLKVLKVLKRYLGNETKQVLDLID